MSRDGRRVALMGLAWACLLSAGQVVMGVEPVISEFMASNAGTLADEDGDHSDWIEIHNPDAGAVNLAGWYLTDDAADLTKWAFPDIDVAGDAYMVVFASGKDRATAGEELHAGFKLSAGGEYIALVMPDGVSVVDEFGPEYPPQHADISYGRIGASVGYFATATPGASNALVAYEGFAEDVVFDVDHGYFEFPFALALSSETAGAEIHYTTNGSVPTESDPSYSGSMMIGETTIMRARAFRSDLLPSRTATRTYLFVDDIVLQSPDGQEPGPAWPEPYGPHSGFHDPQDIDYGMDPDIVVHDARYAGLVEDALLAVPSMSLVTDLAHLFDPSSGIYVNAKQRGEAWERPASLELIDPNGDAGFQIDCGVRIRGGWSRWGSCPKHALRFYFDSDYGDEMLEFPLFGDEGASAFRKVDLRTAQNYSWAFKGDSRNTMLRDIFCRGLQREMGQPYTRSRYVHLYIDGQYWGLYQTQERSKADFAETYLGGNRDDYDTVKVGDTLDVRGEVEVADGNADAWNALRAAAVVGFADNDDYFGVQGLHPDGTRDPGQVRLVDVDNLIDFMICIYYMGTDDAPISSHLSNTCNNFYGVFNRSHPDGFKWFVHDNEHVMDIKGLHYNRTGDLTVLGGDWGQYFNPQTLHQELDVNPEYVMRFADHVHEHFFNGGALTPDRLLVMWDGYAADIELAIVAESARWGDAKVADPLTRDDDWAPNVQYVHDTFIPQRTGIVLGQFRSRGWYPNVDAPVFSVNGVPQHGGHASVGDELTMANPNGAGIVYYTVDGSDPRVVGGAVSGTAQVFDGTPVLLTGSLYVKSRVLAAGGWSALNAAGYDVDSLPIVISEIMYHPAGDADAEFVEMHNPSGTHGVDMSGWRLEGVGLTFPEGTMLPAGAYAVVARDLAAFEDTYGAGTLVVATYGGRLDNGGELLSLVDGAGTCVDVVRYEDVPPWPVSPDGSGPSLELVDVASDNAQVAGWASSLAPLGTPGAANSVAGTTPPLPALWVNEVLPVNQSVNTDEAGGYDPWIELYNASSDPINVGGMYVTDDYATPTKWQISPGTVVDAAGWLLIWADGAPGEGAAHTNFTLDPAGGGVGLYTSDGRVVDYVNYGPLPADVSYGKYPDGFVACRPLNAPTPGGANVSGSAAVILNEYNAVSSGNFLKDGGSDGRLGVVQGNGGNWFELVVTEDHTDMRQWSLAWTEGGDAGVLVLTDAPQWADLRAGTIVTFSELDHAAGGLDTDMSYDPAGGDWWLHVNTLSGGVAQEAYVTTTTNVLGDGPGHFSVGNDDWQLTILDATSQVVFGPAGEGVAPASGVGSDEVCKLEEDPGDWIQPHANYNDGTSSTLGSPNVYAGGTLMQSFAALREGLGLCQHDEDCDDGLMCNGEESCVDGACVSEPGPCDDGIGCTEDSCDEETGACGHTPVDALCDNGLFCDGAESCVVGVGCQAGGDPCPDQLCDELLDICGDGACHVDGDCTDGIFCNGQERCVDHECVTGVAPCGDPCERCNESAGVCEWCLFDLDGDRFIGPGDFAFFAGCYGDSYACDAPAYRSGESPCCVANFDGSSDSFVGPGDFAGLAGCYGGACGTCGNCWGE